MQRKEKLYFLDDYVLREMSISLQVNQKAQKHFLSIKVIQSKFVLFLVLN